MENYTDLVTELLDVDWAQVFDSLSTDDMWSYFHNIFANLIDKHVPTSNVFTSKEAKWMTSSTIHKIRLKRKSWIKYKITLADSDYEAYAKCRNEATKAIRASKYSYEKSIVDKISSSPKYFWQYVNSKIKVKNSLSELQRSAGTFTNSDGEIVNILNNYFGTVFTVEDTCDVPFLTVLTLMQYQFLLRMFGIN